MKKNSKQKNRQNIVIRIFTNPIIRSLAGFLGFLIIILVVISGNLKTLPVLNNYQFFVVMSGSMEPKIKTGSIVLVDKRVDTFFEDDIITFQTPRTSKIVTHRINSVSKESVLSEDTEQNVYSTKGDANDAYDPWVLLDSHIIGRVNFSIPLLGYIVNFSKTPKGFVLIVVIPALLIIFDEIMNIKKVIASQYQKKIKDLENKLSNKKVLSNEL